MRGRIPEKLSKMADLCSLPLYVVGGSVRDFLAGRIREHIDWDICSPAAEETLLAAAKECGMEVRAVYPRTGTIKLSDGANEYEFTRFRTDKYVRGMHAPAEIMFTDEIVPDARRRDFCANAVYYDVKRGEIVDPLGGADDIAHRRLRTVAPAEKVFGEDGLRLMRLARIAAQTGFSPDAECLEGAKRNAALIRDIVPERIFAELRAILRSDEVSGDAESPYRGLCILRDTGVLAEILPELALGDKMAQNPAYHKYDVLEHSLRTVLYSPPGIRFAALLHDVGKPFCFLRDGNFYHHAEEGERIARDILNRLRAPARLTKETAQLVAIHMRDYNYLMREVKVKRDIVKYIDILDDLFALKQADYSACTDDLSPAPVVVKWKGILETMREENIPLRVSELKVTGLDLQKIGVPAARTSEALDALLDLCVCKRIRNTRYSLLNRAARMKF